VLVDIRIKCWLLSFSAFILVVDTLTTQLKAFCSRNAILSTRYPAGASEHVLRQEDQAAINSVEEVGKTFGVQQAHKRKCSSMQGKMRRQSAVPSRWLREMLPSRHSVSAKRSVVSADG
jgi:hypothetical protein